MDAAFFLVRTGVKREWVGPVNSERAIVGRWPYANIRLDDLSVSQVHASLRVDHGVLEVRDLDSRNGTRLNGTPVDCALAHDGDFLHFGSETFQVRRVPTPGESVLESPTDISVGEPKSETRIVPAAQGFFFDLECLPERLEKSGDSADAGALYWLCATLGSMRDDHSVKQELLSWCRRWTGAQHAVLVSRKNGKFVALASSPTVPCDELDRRVSWSIVSRTVEQQSALLHNGVDQCPELVGCDSLVQSRTGAVLCVPVPGSGAPLGALYLAKTHGNGEFADRDLQLMLGASRVLSIARRQVRRQRHLSRENRRLRRELRDEYRIVAGPAMDPVLRKVRQAAKVDIPVLVTGESGTGKELAARVIHYEGPRADKPFVAINCAAVNENLLESELFGHEQGAFTGAAKRYCGLFEQADGGTLLLDEVGNMSLALQARLLRVLEDQTFQRLGGQETLRVNVRIIAATNAELGKAVAQGTFRHDLYFRLNVLSVHLPPLRERSGDLDLLVDHFLQRFARKFEKPIRGLRPAARRKLDRHPWPGNIRELANVLERAVVSCEGPYLEADDVLLDPQGGSPRGAPAAIASLEEVERWHIQRTLEYAKGNKARAAELLGINRMTLYRKLRGATSARDDKSHRMPTGKRTT